MPIEFHIYHHHAREEEIVRLLHAVLKQGKHQEAKLDQLSQDLSDALTGLLAAQVEHEQAIQQHIGALDAAMQNNDAPAMSDAIQKIKTATSNMVTQTKELADDLSKTAPATTAPAPTEPVPAPTDTGSTPAATTSDGSAPSSNP